MHSVLVDHVCGAFAVFCLAHHVMFCFPSAMMVPPTNIP